MNQKMHSAKVDLHGIPHPLLTFYAAELTCLNTPAKLVLQSEWWPSLNHAEFLVIWRGVRAKVEPRQGPTAVQRCLLFVTIIASCGYPSVSTPSIINVHILCKLETPRLSARAAESKIRWAAMLTMNERYGTVNETNEALISWVTILPWSGSLAVSRVNWAKG